MTKLKVTFILACILTTLISTCFASDKLDAPQNPWLLYYTGMKHYDQKEYAEAIQAFTEVISIKSDLVDAYIYRGICYEELHNSALRDIDITKAIEINPKRAYEKLGELYLIQYKPKPAIYYCTKLIELEPNNEDAYSIRGQAYIKIKEYELRK